jgi:predicted nuclease with TOPRIM domain
MARVRVHNLFACLIYALSHTVSISERVHGLDCNPYMGEQDLEELAEHLRKLKGELEEAYSELHELERELSRILAARLQSQASELSSS